MHGTSFYDDEEIVKGLCFSFAVVDGQRAGGC